LQLNSKLNAHDLQPAIARAVALATEKILRLEERWKTSDGAPVFTVQGRYTARSWTQWTQGFQYGCGLICFEMNGDERLLAASQKHTLEDMAEHLTHTGVHDHGFNNVSTYGHLRRLMRTGKMSYDANEMHFYELALKVSGAVQAARWTPLDDGLGYIHSFNGAHSLFIDTIRTLRICALSHTLGHALLGEQDERINLLARLLAHAKVSSQFNIYFGEGRDAYDTPQLRGRTVHEAVFNVKSKAFRCPSSQQGFSPFTTWTRGLAWAMCGYAEQLEFVHALADTEFGKEGVPVKAEAIAMLERAARATCDFYIDQGTASDGICYWDTGAPDMHRLGDWQRSPADPYNEFEPVDASASAIAAQGLLRLGHALGNDGAKYTQAGFQVLSRLLDPLYLSHDPAHEGLLLHSIYHRPNGWDYIPAGSKVPHGEACMWGDYHLLEAMLLADSIAKGHYYTFFDRGAR
jgi:unsaturated chondroitin disaccharide hydrolase